jgi:MYXO-CTERM domain-containing protein
MNAELTKTVLSGIVCAGLAGGAFAGVADVDIVSGATHSGVNLSVTVQESSMAGYDFEFIIANNSTGNGAAITGIYFEAGWATSGLLSGSNLERNLSTSGDGALGGVNFREGNGDPAGIAGWTDSLVSYDVRDSSPGMEAVWLGVDEGESARIAFQAGSSGVTLADLEAALGSSGFNIAIRLQDLFTSDNYVAGWGLATLDSAGALPGDGGDEGEGDGGEATSMPTPTAAAAGLALLAIAGYRRRRDG